jgi:hypothetical protein
MNEDIIKWAREAGMERVVKLHSDGTRTVELPHPDLLARFAALVRADEREACAKVCYELPWKDMDCIPSNLAFAAAIRARSQE